MRPAPPLSHLRALERLYAIAPINQVFPSVLSVSAGAAIVRYQVTPDLFHAAQGLHGAAYFKCLDDAAFFAANSVVTDVLVLTVTFSVALVRPVPAGQLVATAKLVHDSSRLLTAIADLHDESGRVVAQGLGTFMPSNIPLTSLSGYAHEGRES